MPPAAGFQHGRARAHRRPRGVQGWPAGAGRRRSTPPGSRASSDSASQRIVAAWSGMTSARSLRRRRSCSSRSIRFARARTASPGRDPARVASPWSGGAAHRPRPVHARRPHSPWPADAPGGARGRRIVAARLRPGEDALFESASPVSRAWECRGRSSCGPLPLRAFDGHDRCRSRQRGFSRACGRSRRGARNPGRDVAATIFHAAVGDVIGSTPTRRVPLRLRVASLQDTVLQARSSSASRRSRRCFPIKSAIACCWRRGARVGVAHRGRVARDRVGARAYGVGVRRPDVVSGLPPREHLPVTFQSLGSLGLVSASSVSAVIARNVLERRRELAARRRRLFPGRCRRIAGRALRARGVRTGVGALAAVVAIVPVLLERGGGASALPVVWLLAVSWPDWPPRHRDPRGASPSAGGLTAK
jgi:hypothetical protein